MTVRNFFAQRATLSRSIQLLRAVQCEQSNPQYFYSFLAQDTLRLVLDMWYGIHGTYPFGCTLVDVGSGPGYFSPVFADNGFHYIGVDYDIAEMRAAGYSRPTTSQSFIQASGLALPFEDNSIDIVLSSNVAEHIANPWQLGEELLRIVRPGGLVVYSYTVWLGPFGGHETGLFHYCGGYRAARRYQRRYGHPPKNNYGTSLFAVSVTDGLKWARNTNALYTAFPRYHPYWAWWITHVPVIREFLTSNVVLVLQKPF